MGMGQNNSLVLLVDGPERLPNQAMDTGLPLPGSAHLPEDLNCGLDWIVQCPFVHVLPSTPNTVKKKSTCGQSTTSRKPYRLPIVVIVDRDYCAGLTCGPGTREIQNGPLPRRTGNEPSSPVERSQGALSF